MPVSNLTLTTFVGRRGDTQKPKEPTRNIQVRQESWWTPGWQCNSTTGIRDRTIIVAPKSCK